MVFILCVVFTLIWARIAAVFANKATPKTLNRVTGVILVILGIVVFYFHFGDRRNAWIKNDAGIFY